LSLALSAGCPTAALALPRNWSQKCISAAHVAGNRAAFEWRRALNITGWQRVVKTLKKWSGAYAVHSAKLQISDTRTGLTSSVAYLTPPADAQAREEFYREVLPHTVSF